MATAKKKGSIESAPVAIPPLNIQRISLRVVGDSSLISHAWSRKARQQMLDTQMKRARGPRTAKDPFADFASSLYWLDEREYAPPADLTRESWDDVVQSARFGLPSAAFKGALVDAATFLDAFTKVALRGALHVVGDMVQIVGRPTIREDMVRIAMGKADIRHRAEFLDWSAQLMIDHNPNAISTEQIAHLVTVAGFACGVGNWRPQRDGNHGRFHVA